MKVLVSDNLGEIGIQMFQAADGIDVDVKTGLAPEELKSIIGDYDALVIRSATKVTEDLLEAAGRLKVVGRAGIGLDNVDIPAASKRGVVVMNTPTGNVVTTAEHAIAMMLALSRNIPRGTATLKAGKWDKKKAPGAGDLQQGHRRHRLRKNRLHRCRPSQRAEDAGHYPRPLCHPRTGPERRL